jgi:hypothetical protein
MVWMSLWIRVEKKSSSIYPHINSPNNNNQYLKIIDYSLLRTSNQTIFAGIVQIYVEGHTRRGKHFYRDVGHGPAARCH